MNSGSVGKNNRRTKFRESFRAEQDLFVMERYINDIWQFLPIPVAYLNPIGVILDVSRSLVELLHYRKEELVGGSLIGLFSEQEKMRQIQRLTLEMSRVSDHQCVVRNKEGKGIPVNVSTLIRKDEKGDVLGYFVALLDISKRKSVEEAFNISEAQYRATLNSISDGIFVVDRSMRLIMVNDALRTRIKELGIDIEPVGRKMSDVFNFLPEKAKAEYAEVFEKGEMLISEEKVNVHNRELLSEVRKIPVLDGGKVSQVVTVIHDLTAKKRDEQVKAVLYRVSREVNATKDLRELFDLIQRNLNTIIDCRNFFIALRNKEDRAISLAYFVDEREDFKALPSGRTLTNYVVENNRPLLVTEDDIRQMMQAGQIDAVDTPAKAWLGVPLRVKDAVVGALVVHNYRDPSAYTRRDMEILEFVSEQVAAAIERKRVDEEVEMNFERLKKTSTSIIFTMAKILELRDPYTAGHQQRVARLACAIAREMGLNDEEVDGIFMAALIHDIGKIYVPAEILNRPAKLNETEMDLVRTHPSIGYDIVKEIDFSQPVDRIIVQHHERIDGSGYPNGISGNDMILQAKILAVADVVEAMASHRPYRPALSLDEALTEIDKYRDTLYDGHVVDACVRVCRESTFKFD